MIQFLPTFHAQVEGKKHLFNDKIIDEWGFLVLNIFELEIF